MKVRVGVGGRAAVVSCALTASVATVAAGGDYTMDGACRGGGPKEAQFMLGI